MQVANPVAGLPEVGALGIPCGQAVHVHEATDPHRFDEEPLRRLEVSDNGMDPKRTISRIQVLVT